MEFIVILAFNVIKIFKYTILARVLISWIQVKPDNKIVRMIYEITEPLLKAIRRILPRTGMIDFAPLLAFFALDFLGLAIGGLLVA